MGTIIFSKNIELGKDVIIGPFTFISAKAVKIDDHSKVRSLSVISARIIELGKYVHIAPLSVISGDHSRHSIFKVGDHSRFFPFCWIEPGEGIEIGNNVGIGGHTLMFTHGVWPDYLDGGPIAYGPVKIEDNVWLPWRVFIMPNVVIGKNAIIGANSTVTKSVPENVIAAGSPAKVVNESAINELTPDKRLSRLLKILEQFAEQQKDKKKQTIKIENDRIVFIDQSIIIDQKEDAKKGDLLFILNREISDLEIDKLISTGTSVVQHMAKKATLVGNHSLHNEFIFFLRKYGIRLYIN